MNLSRNPATELPRSSQAFIIAKSRHEPFRFSKKQKWGIAILLLIISASCVYMYLISKASSAFGVLALFTALLTIAFRQLQRNKPHFVAVADQGAIIIDFDIDGKNDTLERHRIVVPAHLITGYDTHSFLGGAISHVSIQFTENDQVIATRPIIVEALTKEELDKLLHYLDAQVSHVRRLNGA